MPAKPRNTQDDASTDEGTVATLSPGAQALENRAEAQEVAAQRKALAPVRVSDLADLLEGMSFDEAVAALSGTFTVDTVSADLIGDGYEMMKDKGKLVNIPMVLLQWQFSNPENESFGSKYVIITAMTVAGRRIRFVDGSTGVCEELWNFTNARAKAGNTTPNVGLILPDGLSKSEYTYIGEDGKEAEATTFHLALPSA